MLKMAEELLSLQKISKKAVKINKMLRTQVEFKIRRENQFKLKKCWKPPLRVRK